MKKPNLNKSASQRIRDKAEIKTTTMVGDDAATKLARSNTKGAGSVMTPPGHKYKGSIVVHVYENNFDNRTNLTFKSMIVVGDGLNEVEAGLAVDDLKRKSMTAYGRSPVGK